MTIVSNASPLINLARIGLFDLLHKLYGVVFIPPAVWHEIVVQGAGQVGAREVQTADWITRQSIANELLAQALQQELDAGEAEAIVLALETRAELLVMDERNFYGSSCRTVMGCHSPTFSRKHIWTHSPHAPRSKRSSNTMSLNKLTTNGVSASN